MHKNAGLVWEKYFLNYRQCFCELLYHNRPILSSIFNVNDPIIASHTCFKNCPELSNLCKATVKFSVFLLLSSLSTSTTCKEEVFYLSHAVKISAPCQLWTDSIVLSKLRAAFAASFVSRLVAVFICMLGTQIGLRLGWNWVWQREGGDWGCSNWQLTSKMDFNSSVRCSASSTQRSLPAKRSFKHSIWSETKNSLGKSAARVSLALPLSHSRTKVIIYLS